MYDDNNKTELGTLQDKTVFDSLSSIITDSGEWIITDKPDYSSMVLTSVTNGKKLENGVDIGGHTYFLDSEELYATKQFDFFFAEKALG